MTKSVLVILVVVALGLGLSSMFVIQERELAIVTQFGKFKYTVTEPGLYWKRPFVDQVHRMERRILGSDTPPAEYLTLDKKKLVADPITRWKITNPLKFFKTVNNESAAKARLDDIVNSELRREIASHNFGDIIGNARDPLMQKIANNTRGKVRTFGIEIVDVRIKRADLPREVQESVFQRMRAERDRVAKKYRSEGAEEATKIKAETDKERKLQLAQAYSESQKLRGNGDAESIRIYAESFGADPDFYGFLRAMEAYEASIDKDARIVMSTDAEILKFIDKP